MRLRLVAAALTLCAFVAAPALAQPIQYQAADGMNNTPVSTAQPLPVTCIAGCTGGTGGAGTLANASPTTVTEGSTTTPLSLDLNRNLRVVFSNPTISLSGTLPAFASPPTFNLGTLNGAATAANQATANTSLSAIAASAAGPIPAQSSHSIDIGGTELLDSGGVAITDATNHAANVRPLSITTGGATPYHFISTASTNSTLVSTGAHTLYSLTLTGLNATAGYVRLYDAASAPTCSSGTGAVHTYLVIGSATAQGGLIVPLPPQGEAYANGLAFCVTGGSADTDNTSGPAGILINATYK